MGIRFGERGLEGAIVVESKCQRKCTGGKSAPQQESPGVSSVSLTVQFLEFFSNVNLLSNVSLHPK